MSDSAEGSSLRELIPSLPNTLLRCHSTVRGLRKRSLAVEYAYAVY
jgi:hypothetical protein